MGCLSLFNRNFFGLSIVNELLSFHDASKLILLVHKIICISELHLTILNNFESLIAVDSLMFLGIYIYLKIMKKYLLLPNSHIFNLYSYVIPVARTFRNKDK